MALPKHTWKLLRGNGFVSLFRVLGFLTEGLFYTAVIVEVVARNERGLTSAVFLAHRLSWKENNVNRKS